MQLSNSWLKIMVFIACGLVDRYSMSDKPAACCLHLQGRRWEAADASEMLLYIQENKLYKPVLMFTITSSQISFQTLVQQSDTFQSHTPACMHTTITAFYTCVRPFNLMSNTMVSHMKCNVINIKSANTSFTQYMQAVCSSS